MNTRILELYALAVCFVMLASMTIAASVLLWNLMGFATPDFTLDSYNYQCNQADEAYLDCFQVHFNALESEGLPGGLEGAELTQKRERAYAVLLSTEQRSSAQSAVICLIIFVLCWLVFAFHWRLARKSRE